MHGIIRWTFILAFALVGWFFTLFLGVLAARYFTLSTDLIAWVSIAGLLGWGLNAHWVTENGIRVPPARNGPRPGRRVRPYVYPFAFAVLRSLGRTIGVGVVFIAMYWLTTMFEEGRAVVVAFFNFAPEHISSNVITGAAVVIAAIVTVAGSRLLTDRRSAQETNRERRIAHYPALLEAVNAAERRSARSMLTDAGFNDLLRCGVLVSSHSVLDVLGTLVAELQSTAVESADAVIDPNEFRALRWELVRAMRSDLSLTSPEDAEKTWARLYNEANHSTEAEKQVTLWAHLQESLK